MTTNSPQVQRLERLIVGAACLVSAFLLIASVGNFIASRQFALFAVTGQVEREFFGAVRERCAPRAEGQVASIEEIRQCLVPLFEEKKSSGLRYVAFAMSKTDVPFTGIRNARTFLELGSRLTPYERDVDAQYRGHPVPVEDLFYYAMPPNPEHTQVAVMIFEFEPTQANSLLFLGWLTLLSGVVGVLTTVGGSLLIIRFARQRELANQKAKEKEKLAVLGQMSAVTAHELRNPLASAKGHSQLLVEMLEPGTRVQKKAQQTVQELLRVEHLTNDLLDFIRSGKVNRSSVSPEKVAQNAINRAKTVTPIELDSKEAPEQWSLDTNAIERVLINLVNNAAQAQGDATEPIEVTLRASGEELYLSVRDHGPGFPKGADKIVPFVTTKPTGNGLGLAICEQILKAHNGRITLSNHPTKGALVELYIPRQ